MGKILSGIKESLGRHPERYIASAAVMISLIAHTDNGSHVQFRDVVNHKLPQWPVAIDIFPKKPEVPADNATMQKAYDALKTFSSTVPVKCPEDSLAKEYRVDIVDSKGTDQEHKQWCLDLAHAALEKGSLQTTDENGNVTKGETVSTIVVPIVADPQYSRHSVINARDIYNLYASYHNANYDKLCNQDFEKMAAYEKYFVDNLTDANGQSIIPADVHSQEAVVADARAATNAAYSTPYDTWKPAK